MTLSYKRKLRSYSRQLRSGMTDCERLLWSRINRKQILGVQFYRQKPIGRFILDFYANCPPLAIELDGGQHCDPKKRQRDFDRDRYVRASGIYMLRFSNTVVLENCDEVLEKIACTITKLKGKKLS